MKGGPDLGLTRIQCLEIENQVLKDVIGQAQRSLEKFSQTSPDKRYEFETMIDCIVEIRANINEEYIRESLELRKSMEEWRQAQKSRQPSTVGKTEKKIVYP